MTDKLAVFIRHQRNDAVAGFSQFFYEFGLGQSTEGGRNGVVYKLRVVCAFIADVNHPAI